MGQVEEGSKWNGRHVQFVMTPPRGDPLKSNSISMYFPFRERERDFACSSWHQPVQEGSVTHSSLSSLHTLSSQTREMFTHKARGVVVTNGLGIAKSCRDEERGSEVAEGRRGTVEKGKEGAFQPLGQSQIFQAE